ncbi:hypothetical protein I305_00370 [Cryptococcus gattii E566]|uniref:Uncharacterized protein n=2 Tax=Cryptococcus gattii TaxID=37769 RepID=E6QYF3_CRYGW|nr:Hypothetical Protein CGB_A7590C [Cryptococcus gattii WM276]ADV19863.1 Hypothetical Protein CGB_A7590C [Cryptococcus gattii WM276]KIR79551.1 hypothetical protein I306_03447 [Cryptococcus gattii EJB2]KIY37274.1 hypothetical protein I305_00370 [Cryptococcus gattii E566]KJE01196.1 hypothetical protein I311_05166 [Cryptococcus gattii NT-10]
MPIAAQQQSGSNTTTSAEIVGNPSTSGRARRRRRREPALHRTRRERRTPARFDDEEEAGQQFRRPPRPPRSPRLTKYALCGETLPRQHLIADGDVDAFAIPQHAIDCIKDFHSECKKITVDTCITCNERWFDLDVSREGRCKRCRSSYLRRTKFTAYNNMDPGKSLGDLCEEAGIQRPEPPSHVEELLLSKIHLQVQYWNVMVHKQRTLDAPVFSLVIMQRF